MAEQWEHLVVLMETGEKGIPNIMPYGPDGTLTGQWTPAPAALNALGEQGWDIVSTSRAGSSTESLATTLILKRRKP